MIVFVIGLPRAGLGAVSAVLGELGFQIEPRDGDVAALNGDILGDRGAPYDWEREPPEDPSAKTFTRLRAAMAAAVEARKGTAWALVDARLLTTLPYWLPIIAEIEGLGELRIVNVYREDAEVASSMSRAGGFKEELRAQVQARKGLETRLRAWLSAEPSVPLIRLSYDYLTTPAGRADAVGYLARLLGVELKASAIEVVRTYEASEAADIETALTEAELAWVRAQSAEAEARVPEAVLLHIGVWKGASVVASREGAPRARIIGVDRLGPEEIGFTERIGIEWVKGDSTEVYKDVHSRIDFGLIDGGHDWNTVTGDIEGYSGKVRPGGVLAFHDYRIEEVEPRNRPWAAQVAGAVDSWYWAPTTWEEIEAPGTIRAFRRLPLLRGGDSFGTLGFGVPYWRPVYKFFRWWSWVLLGGLRRGDRFLNNEDVPGEVAIPVSHNALVRQFLREDRDTLCIIEDDHEAGQDAIELLRSKEANLPYDIVCASYAQKRRGFSIPVGFNFNPEKTSALGEKTCTFRLRTVAREGTQEYQGAALGLVLIRRWVLEALQQDPDPNESAWFDWRYANSQDVAFYWRASQAGARVGVDRDLQIGHVGQATYYMRDFYRMLDETIAAEEAAKEKEEAK